MNTIRTISLLALAQTLSLLTSFAQSPSQPDPARAPTFSIVSIKPSGPSSTPGFQTTKDGLILKVSSTLSVIQFAYGLPNDDFVVGAPKWVSNHSYDLVAKVDAAEVPAYSALKPADKTKLLREVLKERFKLAFHYEDRAYPEFALVIKRSGINKENLRPAQGGYQWKVSGRYTLDAKSVAIQDFCNMVLASESGRPVVDQSGLPGKYDFQLHWSPRYDSDSNSHVPSSDAPDIFTAIQEQLGLQLVPRKVPVKVLVIDHIEPPSVN